MPYEIVHLPKENWRDYALPIGYATRAHYEIRVEREPSGFTIRLQKKPLPREVSHTPEEHDFPDRLYAAWWEGACAWGVIEDGALIAAIETCPEEWSNRLRVTELWVDEKHQKKGLGRALLGVAREQARLERRRAIMLETQSSNVNAIDFYLHEGFTLIGLDTCCYKNNDVERGEVRVEMGLLLPRGERVTSAAIEIRRELPEDAHAVDAMVRRAFHNLHGKGCNEHLLTKKLRNAPEYLPEISRIALVGGEVIGAIFYSKAQVVDGDTRHEVATFGPLAVRPDWWMRGVGTLLLEETLPLAAKAGFPGVVIFGEPEFYPRVGFKTCDQYGVTTKDGKNFKAFMAYELTPGAMAEVHGKFYEAPVFEDLPKDETEAYDREFKPMQKQYFPTHWA